MDAHVEAVALRVLEERYRDAAPHESVFPAEDQLTRLRSCESPTDLTRMQLRDLEEDRREFYARQADRNLLARFTTDRWSSYDIRQKRLALAAVVESVVIRPIPKTRTRNAPFDPALVEITLKER
ncbi:hypothetical protein [Streptomyces exfoliatus]|uniref:hypothetical protein n=1 Tax=Streptomyces exfoliatus TaxID=1905 RepID=UPI0037BC60F4